MIEVIYRDGKLLAKGSFALGLAGTFTNNTFDDTMIQFSNDYDYISKELSRPDSWRYQPLFPYLKTAESPTEQQIATGLAVYYNQKEREAQQHIKEINDCLLYQLFDNLENCAYPFWEIPEAIIPDSLDGYDPDELENIVYDQPEYIYKWGNAFYNRPNNGTVPKPDVEARLREAYPMFNFDGLFQSIIPEGIVFSGRFMEFQFSDAWGAELYECAYDRFDENFTSCDWHNH